MTHKELFSLVFKIYLCKGLCFFFLIYLYKGLFSVAQKTLR